MAHDYKFRASLVGEWRGCSAGGSPRHESFFSNPQLSLSLSSLQQVAFPAAFLRGPQPSKRATHSHSLFLDHP